ncbi:MAG: phosphoribosylglycinamide formyltransferase [Marine Group III euryarchaeote CG-Bathy1]|uniref:phosphoribosylglycinamide formyltransferase 1 n=1 Tax=Marine Group III euryarchaeote CG-Bathy1 TaxID=1889001 RepID=A0A1J5T2V9_9ARCH|nr:MAG: phosphoribosylglycinamide formyltransferase [Marine Group III euryarchaeote CG-Bathy1]
MRIAVLASGRGSNFQSLIDASERGDLPNVDLVLLVVNNKEAKAIDRAEKHSIDWIFINHTDKERVAFDIEVMAKLDEYNVEGIILAGFMRILSKEFISNYKNRILNIHPSLLPLFPGAHAHRDALEANATKSGCTVHFVDEGVDTGSIILQKEVVVKPDDTEETLSSRILVQEHIAFPEALHLFSSNRLKITSNGVEILPP